MNVENLKNGDVIHARSHGFCRIIKLIGDRDAEHKVEGSGDKKWEVATAQKIKVVYLSTGRQHSILVGAYDMSWRLATPIEVLTESWIK